MSDNPSSTLNPPPAAPKGWVLLALGERWLAVRHEGVRGIEPWSALTPTLGGPVAAHHRGGWPAYRVDGLLCPTSAAGTPRFAVFLEAFPEPIGLAADQVRILSPAQAPAPRPLPRLFAAAPGAAEGVLVLDDEDIVVAVDPVLLGHRLRGDAPGGLVP